jgi:rapamycin-insensitive companion of mTOR
MTRVLDLQTSTWETTPLPRPAILSPPTQHIEKEILIAFANLSNHILAAKASQTLARLKERHREFFVYPGSVDGLATAMPTTTPIELFYRAFEIIGSHHYLISVRRFILDLFEIGLDATIMTTIMTLGDGLLQEGKKRLEAGESIILQESSRESSQVSFDEEIEDDDDGSDGSASTFEEGKVIMPVQILDPIVFTRGFNL